MVGFDDGDDLGKLRGAPKWVFVVGDVLSDEAAEQTRPQSDVVHVLDKVEGRH